MTRERTESSLVSRWWDEGIARHGYDITDGENKIGEVTSGSIAFTLDKNIGLGYVPTDFSAPGTKLWIQIRRRTIKAVVRPLPFYSRRTS